ncbi:hypothetical protein BpHYR1_030706 [Brachionus plicatilis]|uniref:Uncharacterized protein n=1 Tax=Brachionus plicatilis TaxID=10195 RepID=A0A3M7PK69_BRAPC|nr:hypothetical protein BpHYR1_030706 [Brachionus plicatilis]
MLFEFESLCQMTVWRQLQYLLGLALFSIFQDRIGQTIFPKQLGPASAYIEAVVWQLIRETESPSGLSDPFCPLPKYYIKMNK